MTTTQLIHETPAFLHKVGDRILDFIAGIQDARDMAQRFKALSRLSDAELASQGLNRHDILRAVFPTPQK
jgi:hypothetical protein